MTTQLTPRAALSRPSQACIMPRVFEDKRQNLKTIASTGIVSYNLEAIRDRCQVQTDCQAPRDLVRTVSQMSLRWDHKRNRATLHVLGGLPDWCQETAEDGGLVFTKNGLRMYAAEVFGGHGLARPERVGHGLGFIDRLYQRGSDAGHAQQAAEIATVNAFLMSAPQTTRMLQLRTVRTKDGVDSNGRPRIVRAVRAVFRDYTAFDDIDCLNALLDCPNTRDLPVISYRRGDDGMRIRFALETDVRFEVNRLIPMGSLRNSETGRSAIWWHGGGFRPTCLNGMGTSERGANVSWRHSGRRSRVSDGLPQAVRESQVKAHGLVDAYGRAMDTVMDNAAEWMRTQLAAYSVGEADIEASVKALSHPTTTPGRMLASTVDAVTWVAQQQADELKQRELETIGGRLLHQGLAQAEA